MKTWQRTYYACIAGFISSMLYCLYYDFMAPRYQKKLIITQNEYLTSVTRKEIARHLTGLMDISQNTTTIYRLLQKKFPGIVKITRNQFFPSRETIHLQYDLPLITIKQPHETPHVLTRQGHIVPMNHYCDVVTVGLPAIMLAQKPHNVYEHNNFYQWVCGLPPAFYDHYQAFWESSSKIILHDMHDTMYTYIITHQTILDQLESPYLKQLKNTCVQNCVQKKKPKKWNIDLRFQDHYIAQGTL